MLGQLAAVPESLSGLCPLSHTYFFTPKSTGRWFGMEIPHQFLRNVGNYIFGKYTDPRDWRLYYWQGTHFYHFEMDKLLTLPYTNILTLKMPLDYKLQTVPKHLKIRGYFLGNCTDSKLFCKFFAYILLMFPCGWPRHAPLSVVNTNIMKVTCMLSQTY